MGSFNTFLFERIFSLSHQGFLLDTLGVFLAQYLPWIISLWVLLVVVSVPGRRYRMALVAQFALAILLSRGIITELVRFIYPVVRPLEALELIPLLLEDTPGFPSGHTTWLFAMVVPLWHINKKYAVVFGVLALVVGVARIFAGVHWPADIAAGIVVGLLSGWIIYKLLGPYLQQLSAPPQMIHEEPAKA